LLDPLRKIRVGDEKSTEDNDVSSSLGVSDRVLSVEAGSGEEDDWVGGGRVGEDGGVFGGGESRRVDSSDDGSELGKEGEGLRLGQIR